MHPAAVVYCWFGRGIHPSPCRGKVVHQFYIRHVIEKAGFPCLPDDPAGGNCREEVDELASHHRKVALAVGVVQAFIVLVTVEYYFRKPPLIIAKVSSLRIKVLIGFQDDHAKEVLLDGVLLGEKGIFLLGVCQVRSLFSACFLCVLEGI